MDRLEQLLYLNEKLLADLPQYRRQAAAFLSQLSEEPAQPLTAEFVRNPDATLSLSADSLQKVLAAFGAQAAPTQSS